MPLTFGQFLDSRASVGADEQPTWRKLECLVLLMLRTVESRSTEGDRDLKLSEKEVRAVMRKKRR